jgi:hypothetical protein
MTILQIQMPYQGAQTREPAYIFSIPFPMRPNTSTRHSLSLSVESTSLLQRPPRNVFAELHALEMYALDTFIRLRNRFLERRRRSRRRDDAAACCFERLVCFRIGCTCVEKYDVYHHKISFQSTICIVLILGGRGVAYHQVFDPTSFQSPSYNFPDIHRQLRRPWPRISQRR